MHLASRYLLSPVDTVTWYVVRFMLTISRCKKMFVHMDAEEAT